MVSVKACLGLENLGLVNIGASNMLADKESLEAFSELKSKAEADGFELNIASAWRSFQRQFAIFNDKFEGRRAVLDQNERPVDLTRLSPLQKCEAIVRFSAIPGASRHHFGTDFDIYSKKLLPSGESLRLTASEYSYGNCFYELGIWLEKNLHKCGFVRPFRGVGPIACEPWHISYLPRAKIFAKAYDLDAAIAVLASLDTVWSQSAAIYLKEHFKELIF